MWRAGGGHHSGMPGAAALRAGTAHAGEDRVLGVKGGGWERDLHMQAETNAAGFEVYFRD